jgi:glycosyltransferase involved in cell wall biosynthesis
MGGQRSMLALIENLDRSKYRPIAIVPSEADLSEALRETDCPVFVLPLSAISSDRWKTVLSNIRAFRRLYRQEDVAIVHADAERDVFVAGIAKLAARAKLLWHARVAGHNRLDPFVMRLADHIVGVSDAVIQRFPPSIRTKCSTVYNGVDLDLFRPPVSVSDVRRELELPIERPVLLYAGQIVREKGIEEIVMAMSHLVHGLKPEESPVLAILGSPVKREYDRSLVTRIHESGLDPYVIKLEHQSNIEKWMGAADLLLLASYSGHEAMGRVVFEAMACGTVPVVSDIPGVREAVTPESGVLVPEKSPEALADAIRGLLANQSELARLRTGALKRARSTFSITTHARRIESLYDSMLSEL